MLLIWLVSLELTWKFKCQIHSRYKGRAFQEMTRASKTKKNWVEGQMGELKKKRIFFSSSQGFFGTGSNASSSGSGQESREIQTRIPPGGALLCPLRRHWEKYRLEDWKEVQDGKTCYCHFHPTVFLSMKDQCQAYGASPGMRLK